MTTTAELYAPQAELLLLEHELELASEWPTSDYAADYGEPESEPMVMVASELPEDELIRGRAERTIKKAGEVAVAPVFEVELAAEPPVQYNSLVETVHYAAEGDPRARRSMTANVESDVVERTIKAGHVKKIELESDEGGKIWQHGQQMEDVYINSLRFASEGWQMRQRAEAETRNGARIEHHNRAGTLEDYYFVVATRAADNMSTKEMDEAGFFTDTMTFIFQVTSSEGGKLSMESAFVAGVTAPGEERHDAEAVAGVGKAFGVEWEGLTAAETIDTPVLIHKSLMPNGASDLVKIADKAIESIVGHPVFFGQDKPVQDYIEYREYCRKREIELKPTVENIVDELIADAPKLHTPEDATRRLHELSQQHMVDRAIVDHSIDPKVFGPAARHIEHARILHERGFVEEALAERDKAQETAVSSSCPTGKTGQNSAAGEDAGSSAASKSEKSGIKKMTCPFCKDPNQYGDPCSTYQHCTACQAMVVNGKVASTGDGGRKARAEKAKKRAEQFAKQEAKQLAKAESAKLPRQKAEQSGRLAVA